jgi:hypothetical protein
MTNASASLPSQFKIVGSSKYEKNLAETVQILQDQTRPPFYNKKPRDEDELKAVIHAICRCAIDPFVDRERSGARVAGKECKFDFSLFKDRDALEAKLITENHRANTTVAEILEDIEAFRNSQFSNLIFLIYDSIGDISDQAAFKRDLEKSSIYLVIVKH